MRRRPGITLVEVLVSLFIMGVGMIALLTLFPLGALNIAQALRDDRASQAAANAAAFANAMDLRHDGFVAGNPPTITANTVYDRFRAQLNQGLDPDGPSSPVYVDPFYAQLNQATLGAAASTPGLQRVSPTYVTTDKLASAWFSLLDDLDFDPNGLPTPGAGTTVSRAGRYSWAYLLRRPRLGKEDVVDLSVVVYADRVTQSAQGETAYTAQGAIGDAKLTITYTAATKPKVRKGGWILDTTRDGNVVRGFFYRVVDASENSTDTQMTLELLNPLKSLSPGASGNFTVVVMENVVDVFDRGSGYVP